MLCDTNLSFTEKSHSGVSRAEYSSNMREFEFVVQHFDSNHSNPEDQIHIRRLTILEKADSNKYNNSYYGFIKLNEFNYPVETTLQQIQDSVYDKLWRL